MKSAQALSKQHKLWASGRFAKDYARRNWYSIRKLDGAIYKNLGVTRSAINKKFLRGIPKSARILEIGCNAGHNLLHLQTMGYKNVYAIELNPTVVELAKKRVPGAQIIQGDALDVPFKDGFFDLVFTSGVLIHIAPRHRRRVMAEIYRVSRKYIWGFEYFAPRSTEIPYRGRRNVLWKAPFAKLYRQAFPDLHLMREKKYPYVASTNVDQAFLFKKQK